MYWWIPAALQAGGMLYSAVSSSNRYAEQSSLDREYALANSLSIRESGKATAAGIGVIGEMNANAILLSAKVENASLEVITDYNSERSILLGEYNAGLLEEEALLVMEQNDIDIAQLKRQHDRTLGQIKAAHGASGAIMGQDTPGAVVEDAQRQMKTEQMIVRRGADVQFSKLMDKAALSRWQGYEEAVKMQLESKLTQLTSSTNAGLRALGVTTQSAVDRATTTYNASIKADQVFQQGMLSSDNNSAASSSALWGGVFNAATTLASGYYSNKAKQEQMGQIQSLLTTS